MGVSIASGGSSSSSAGCLSIGAIRVAHLRRRLGGVKLNWTEARRRDTPRSEDRRVPERTPFRSEDRGSGSVRHIMRRGTRDAILFATLVLASPFWAGACDIVEGFQNAGDALFPPQKTYLEAPGFRLAEGRFHRLNVGIGDELYLLARDADPMAEPALYSMRFVDPKPCKIPGVGRYWSSGLPTNYPSQIVYLADNARRGTVHFADARCKVHELTLEDADLPYEESAVGALDSLGHRSRARESAGRAQAHRGDRGSGAPSERTGRALSHHRRPTRGVHPRDLGTPRFGGSTVSGPCAGSAEVTSTRTRPASIP